MSAFVFSGYATDAVRQVKEETMQKEREGGGGDKEEERVIHPYRVGVTFCRQL